MSNEINSVAGQLIGIPVGQVYTAGPGIKIDNVNKVVSIDETVLWEGPITPGNGAAPTNYDLVVANMSNYEIIRIIITGRCGCIVDFYTSVPGNDGNSFYMVVPEPTDSGTVDGLLINMPKALDKINFRSGYSNQYETAYRLGQDWGYFSIIKIIGINRIGGN